MAYHDTSVVGGISTSSGGPLHTQDVIASWNNSVTFGDNISNWKQVIADGGNATTSMDGTETKLVTQQIGYGQSDWLQVATSDPNRSERRQSTWRGIFVPSASLTPSFSIPTSSATAENRALARFNAKAAEVNRQFQGGVFFAELHKTLHGITHPAEALFKGIEKYSLAATKLRRSIVKDRAAYQSLSRNARKNAAKSFTKAATGLWLEQSFHWLPLFYDIQGACSAFSSLLDSWPSTFVKVSATDEQNRTTTSGANGWGEGVTFPWTETQASGATVRMYGRVRVGPRTSSVPDMKALGLDVRSFVPTLWELIPYSWAIDYFTNIGDIVYGASYGGCDVMWASIGKKRWSRYSASIGTATSMAPSPGFANKQAYAVGQPALVVTEKATISRAVYRGNFIPFPELKVPGLSLKWLNLGAAFLQRSLAFL
jgi:hypothetical protein